MLIRLFNSDSDVLLCVVARSSILNVITFPFSCSTVFQFVIAIQYSRNQHTLLQRLKTTKCVTGWPLTKINDCSQRAIKFDVWNQWQTDRQTEKLYLPTLTSSAWNWFPMLSLVELNVNRVRHMISLKRLRIRTIILNTTESIRSVKRLILKKKLSEHFE